MRRTLLPLLSFLSGISALIYEIAWVRQASLTFGVSVYAYSAVLTAYMGGMALGSYLLGRWIDRRERPLRVYAALQLGIALLAALTPFVLSSLNGLYAAVARALHPGLGLLTLLRLALSVLALTLPTALIGATFPALSRAYATRHGQVGGDVGRLYTTNTLGGVLGCLLAAVVLVRLLGLRGTVWAAAALNLLLAAGTFALDRSQPTAASTHPKTSAKAPSTPRRRKASPRWASSAADALSPQARRYVLIGYAVSGFVALGYEVVWARILAVHTLHAVYSFALMLTVYLAGLAAGGALGTWWVRRRQTTLAHLGAVQMGIGLLAIAALHVFARLPALSLEDIWAEYKILHKMLYEMLLAALTLFPTTLLIGLVFPLVGSLFTEEQTEQVGQRIGTVSALNTSGSIAGSLIPGFALLPLLGLRDTSLALSAINIALGAGAMWLAGQDRPRLRWTPLPAVAVALVAALLLPPGLYLGFREGPSEFMVFYREGVETTVAVFEVPDHDFKISFVNGRIEVPTDATSMRAFHLLGHLPPLLRPEAKNALMLSFGNGIATGTLAQHGIADIQAVDLSAEMIEAARIYREENHDVLSNPRLRLWVEDARNFLLQSDERYDIITTDATHPANASSWALFTGEFYVAVQAHLAPGGVFVQWLPFHSLTMDDYRAIIRTFQSVFPHAELWYTGSSHTFLVAPPERMTRENWRQVLAQAADDPLVQEDLGTPEVILSYRTLDSEGLAAYAGPGPLVSDDNAFFIPSNDETERILRSLQEAARP